MFPMHNTVTTKINYILTEVTHEMLEKINGKSSRKNGKGVEKTAKSFYFQFGRKVRQHKRTSVSGKFLHTFGKKENGIRGS